jgi:broad-specificity NMP kinase
MKEAPNSEVLEKQRQRLLETLREKGFSEEQINKMKMKEIMKACTPSLVEKIGKGR